MIQIALLLVLANIAIIFGDDNKSKELDRIKRYALINIDTSLFESDGIIELDAHDQHYKIQLESNQHIHPAKIHHMKGNHAEINGHQQFYTNKNESCHFLGKVVNDLKSSQNFVALSLCENRGLRGMIVAFDDTLYIKPAKTYLDLSHDKNGHGHNLNDQHLAYLSSDKDYSGLPLDAHLRISNEEKQFHDSIHSKVTHSNIFHHHSNSNGKRRRMANNGQNTVEIIAVLDPAYIKIACQDKYTTNTWYDSCINDLADLYNGIHAEYWNQNWAGSIGKIAVALAKVYVMFDFSGDDAVLYPDFTYSNCKDMYNTECPIDGSGYLGKLRTWVGNMENKGTEADGGFESNKYDDVQLWSSMNFKDAGGWGYIGTVCRGDLATANIAALYGFDWSVRSAAHELGHNFNMSHDQDTPCGADAGLMGYGSADHGFSSCSVESLQYYFGNRNGLTCLGSSVFGWTTDNLPVVSDIRSNYDTGVGTPVTQPTPRPTPNPTKYPTNRPTPVPTPLPTVPGTPPTTPNPTVPTPYPTNPTPAPTSPTPQPTTNNGGTSDDWQCVITVFPILETSTFSGNIIKDGKLQGRWTSDGTVNSKVAYFKDGYYLYKKSIYWLIATEKDSWTVVGFCEADLLSDCAGKFSFYQGGWVADTTGDLYQSECGVVDTDTSVTTSVTTKDPKQCVYHDCLQMNGLGDLSGVYDFFDCDGVNKGIYKIKDVDSYVCFNLDYNLWFISATRECSSTQTIKAYCKWTNADVEQCGADAWRKLESNSFVPYSTAVIFDCANSPFNAEETTECTDDTLNSKLCIEGNSGLISAGSPLEFSLWNGQCANYKPIYSWTIETKNDTLINLNGIETNKYTERTLYLHYNLYKKYSDDIDYSGQWVISDGEVNSNYDAVCEQESLLDCTENQWQVLSVTSDNGGQYGGGLIQFIDDIAMKINNADCDGNTDLAVTDDEESGGNATIIVIVCLSVVVLLCIGAFFLFRRSNKGDDKMIKRHVSEQVQSNNPTPKQSTADEMPGNGSPIPETEVSMERGPSDGAAEIVVTTTYE